MPSYKNFNSEKRVCKEDETKTVTSFYDEIVKNLKEEAKKLNGKLVIATNRDDMQLYIAAIKSLRETLELIHKYDWQLMYSTYSTTVDDKEERYVAVWEQNHDMQIRNHRVWKVIEEIIE